MNDHFKVLKQALEITKERGQTYDTTGSGVEENFTRAASIASLFLNKPITPRDVALIMASVKMARIAIAPHHQDSYVDLVNYVSFGASFSAPPNGAQGGVQKAPPTTPPPGVVRTLSDLNQTRQTPPEHGGAG